MAVHSSLPILPQAPTPDPAFTAFLAARGLAPLRRRPVTTLQINVGKLCNQACHHCHVDAGPKRTEIMAAPVADQVLKLLRATPSIQTVDITGGAPELNSNFRRLVVQSYRLDKHLIDRCNLTVLAEPGMEDLPEFLAEHEVEISASLPCYTMENVDRQRGRGVFDKSINALHRLNALGYGRPGSSLQLNLVYNPLGPSLPPPQAELESDYKQQLRQHFNIEFHRLFTITNMPIKRFADDLKRQGKTEAYQSLLVNHFSPGTLDQLMCRDLVSVGHDGQLYDCDFNQMLEIPLGADGALRAPTIWDLDDFSSLRGLPIATGAHCFGCTAGTGSSCGGALNG
ncbi:MAG: arsenosugar biosynthesis radical SAM (seleno)protein ArsS [Terriglobales bacterium]